MGVGIIVGRSALRRIKKQRVYIVAVWLQACILKLSTELIERRAGFPEILLGVRRCGCVQKGIEGVAVVPRRLCQACDLGSGIPRTLNPAIQAGDPIEDRQNAAISGAACTQRPCRYIAIELPVVVYVL